LAEYIVLSRCLLKLVQQARLVETLCCQIFAGNAQEAAFDVCNAPINGPSANA